MDEINLKEFNLKEYLKKREKCMDNIMKTARGLKSHPDDYSVMVIPSVNDGEVVKQDISIRKGKKQLLFMEFSKNFITLEEPNSQMEIRIIPHTSKSTERSFEFEVYETYSPSVEIMVGLVTNIESPENYVTYRKLQEFSYHNNKDGNVTVQSVIDALDDDPDLDEDILELYDELEDDFDDDSYVEETNNDFDEDSIIRIDNELCCEAFCIIQNGRDISHNIQKENLDRLLQFTISLGEDISEDFCTVIRSLEEIRSQIYSKIKKYRKSQEGYSSEQQKYREDRD